MSESQRNSSVQNVEQFFFRASSVDFEKIPGSPIAYWISDAIRQVFKHGIRLDSFAEPRQGMATSDNDRFLRHHYEVSATNISFESTSHEEAKSSRKRWFPYSKGGEGRKWYGNNYLVVDWENDGENLLQFAAKLYGSPTRTIKNIKYYFKEALTWSLTSSTGFAARWRPAGFLFDVNGMSSFSDNNYFATLGAINSRVGSKILGVINPTMAFQAGDLKAYPFICPQDPDASNKVIQQTIALSICDWDSYENSWDFANLPLLRIAHHQGKLKVSYDSLRTHWHKMTQEMKRLEEENNRIFIEAYGLQDELTPEVPLKEITLTCNPHYRYGGDKTEEELEALLLADTMREFISYAVGCMFGRYSLDKPGLILANQGETLADYLAQVPEPTFMPDKDNVIPMLDGDWFADDIAERFRRFLRVTFGEEHYEENLRFIEKALNVKGKRSYSLRDYFLSEFYTDHLKRYKKRPIYWLFSSPKGSFNALIYMHRYRPDTVSVVLNDYLREFRAKLLARKNHLEALGISASASQGEKTKALKEIEKISKMIAEVDAYERDTLYPLATQQLEIDLDDGVKANYPKFGAALKKIPGLEAKDD